MGSPLPMAGKSQPWTQLLLPQPEIQIIQLLPSPGVTLGMCRRHIWTQNWLRTQDPDGSCCSGQQILLFSISGLGTSRSVSTPPLHLSTSRWGLENTTSNIPELIWGLIWVWRFVCCGFLCWESWLGFVVLHESFMSITK